MLKLQITSKFRKDYKRIKKRGYDLSLLQDVLNRLCSNEILRGLQESSELFMDFSRTFF